MVRPVNVGSPQALSYLLIWVSLMEARCCIMSCSLHRPIWHRTGVSGQESVSTCGLSSARFMTLKEDPLPDQLWDNCSPSQLWVMWWPLMGWQEAQQDINKACWNSLETSKILWAQVNNGYPDSTFNLIRSFFPSFLIYKVLKLILCFHCLTIVLRSAQWNCL